MPIESWHDSQRVGQVAILFMAIIAGIFSGIFSKIPWPASQSFLRLIGILIILGLISSWQSHQPLWALVEMAIFFGSLGFAWVIIDTFKKLDRKISNAFIIFIIFSICGALTFRFLINYLIGVFWGGGVINSWEIISGFDNPRFFGQFCTLSLPLMSVAIINKYGFSRFRSLAIAIFIIWWSQAIISGTRGTLLGITTSIFIMCFMGSQGRRWACAQIFGATCGLLIYIMLMHFIPDIFDIVITNPASDRLNASLSAREIIWGQAIEMVKDRPILGFGPMHFSDIQNSVAAHPHQAILQWASEWGIPSTILVIFLFISGLWSSLKYISNDAESTSEKNTLYICLVSAIIASLTQSMVDGVFVIPYTELWLTIIIAWLVSMHFDGVNYECILLEKKISSIIVLGLILSLIILVYVCLRDMPKTWMVYKKDSAIEIGHFQPRFWVQGVIANEIKNK